MDFILGCNYWASNGGADMWRFFDADVVEKDISTLSGYGVEYIRVFPNWRDFQPVAPVMKEFGIHADYCLEGDKIPENPYYLDEVMLDRFDEFLNICTKYKIRVIVGLITGYMSGRLYAPSAMYGKNVITDPVAQYFQQLFIKGFVTRFKSNETIYAWDLGNECNSMGESDRINAVNWTSLIANAIKAADPERDIISGMHMLGVDRGKRNWWITDQAMHTDMLTTHPYPYWSEHTDVDDVMSIRATMHATAETKFYSEIGNKPCMTEETGTMGPMICSNENAANFMRVNLFSLWSNDATGLMWWCAHEQTMLSAYPYSENMVERELGMLDKDHNPKPVIKEMKKFSEFLKGVDFKLTEAKKDAVCLLTHGQDQWGVAYMTHILMRQAGLNCKFAFVDGGIPDAPLYLLPSINGHHVMNKRDYEELKTKVYAGADLYISMDSGVLTEFEELTGLKPIDSSKHRENSTVEIDGVSVEFFRDRNFTMKSVGAEVLASDKNDNPAITVYQYGKGRIFYVNFPLESNMLKEADAFSNGKDIIYRKIFSEYIEKLPVRINNKNVVATYHYTKDGLIAVIVNHNNKDIDLNIEVPDKFSIEKIHYGSLEKINAFDACVIELKTK